MLNHKVIQGICKIFRPTFSLKSATSSFSFIWFFILLYLPHEFLIYIYLWRHWVTLIVCLNKFSISFCQDHRFLILCPNTTCTSWDCMIGTSLLYSKMYMVEVAYLLFSKIQYAIKFFEWQFMGKNFAGDILFSRIILVLLFCETNLIAGRIVLLKLSAKCGTRTPCTDCLKKIIFHYIHSISSLWTSWRLSYMSTWNSENLINLIFLYHSGRSHYCWWIILSTLIIMTHKGNSWNKIWHWTNDKIGVAVQIRLWVRVERMAWEWVQIPLRPTFYSYTLCIVDHLWPLIIWSLLSFLSTLFHWY